MALNAMYLQPGALQPNAFGSAFAQAIAGIPQQLLTNQHMQMQNQMLAPNVPLAPQFAAAGLQQAQMQPRLMGAQAYQALGSGNQSNANATLLGTQNRFYPYTLAAGADDVNKMMLYRMMYQGLNNGSLSVQNPAQAAQNSINNTGASLGNIASQLTNGSRSVPSPQPAPQAGGQSPLGLSPMQLAHLKQLYQSGSLWQPGMPPIPGMGAPPGAQIPGGLQASSPAGMRGQALLGAASPQGVADPYNLTGGLVGGDLYNSLFRTELGNTITSIGKNPAFGTNRGGQGGTFNNPLTGQTYSPDTTHNTNFDQQSIAAWGRVAPLMTSLYKEGAPYMTLAGKGKLWAERGANLLGANYSSPSQYAKFEADQKNAAEGLVKAWGLNPTDVNTERLMETVEPMEGESADGYKARIISQMNEIKNNVGQSQGRLAYGTNVTGAQGLNSQAVNVPSQQSAPQQPQQSAPAPVQRIRVIRPDGAAGYIPSSQLNAALGAGYRRG